MAGMDALLPRQTAYVDALGEWSTLGGPMVGVEAGVRLGGHLGLFSWGAWRPAETVVGAGVRVTY